METDHTKDQVSQRGFLEVGSTTLAAAVGALSMGDATNQEKGARDNSRSDPGPANSALDAQNSDSTLDAIPRDTLDILPG